MAKSSKKKRREPEVVPRRAPDPGRARQAQGSPWALPLSRQQGLVLLQALVIVTAGLWIYWPALHGDWLWDDNLYIIDNPLLHDPARLWKIWFAPGSLVEYYPIEATVQWIQWQLWHNATLGYHLTNVFLHVISALLVWRLLGKFGLRLAWLGGLIFAIHPMQVESAAWISELKNTLSLPPFLLAMCAWIDYEEHRKRKDYFLALGLFLVAMLCKISMAMFPVVILLYVWWKRSRIGWSDLKASAPFFVISMVLGVTAILAGKWFLQLQGHPPVHSSDITLTGGFFSWLDLGGLTISFYFSKALLPVELLPLYSKWAIDPFSLVQFLPWPVLVGMGYWLWTKRRSWGSHALLGLGFFLINLMPVLGLILTQYTTMVWSLDHMAYVPLIGLIGLGVAGWEQINRQLSVSLRSCGAGIVAVVMGLMAWGSRAYAGLFINSETLWTYTIQCNPNSYRAHYNLGLALQEKGRLAEAIAQYRQALSISPGFADAHNNLGSALRQTGHISEAMEQYHQALRIDSHYADAYYNLGNALLQAGQLTEAMEQYHQALEINPDYAEAHHSVGLILFTTGHVEEAMEQYNQALRVNPEYAEAHKDLGDALMQRGRIPEGIKQYQEALLIDPGLVDVHNNLGNALLKTGRLAEAIEQFKQALNVDSPAAKTYYNLGNALAQAGRIPEAIAQYQEALRLDPNFLEAHSNLGLALFKTGRIPEAIEQLQAVLRINPHDADARNHLTQLQALQKNAPIKK